MNHPNQSPDLLSALQALTDAVLRFTNANAEDWPELAQSIDAIAAATVKDPPEDRPSASFKSARECAIDEQAALCDDPCDDY